MLLRLFLAMLVAMVVVRLLRRLFSPFAGRGPAPSGPDEAGERRRGLDPRRKVETTWSEVEEEEGKRDH